MSKNKTILIVDDDKSVISIFDFVLKGTGYQTITAQNGLECLDILQSKAVDLIFLDVKMPGMTGIDIFKEIQKKHPSQLVVLMTGYSEDELVKEAFTLGAYGIIYKPFDMEEVLSVIDKILQD
ncbi:response regulator [bacterium]|jgi:DNA-binding NtrC family response regulator|nr:response regulator [bacterium]MBT3580859.1 response regulator [bacterium]MBT4552425.1 response regulator [bacterium]MBT7088036.1 response regulator [bacterium]